MSPARPVLQQRLTEYVCDDFGAPTLPQSTLEAQRNIARTGSPTLIEAVAADTGYHKAETLAEIEGFGLGIRTYVCAAPSSVRRVWGDKPVEWRDATVWNRRRLRGARNRQLQRCRSERVERTFAHSCDTGGARRSWLRGIGDVAKRDAAHIAALNLRVILRKIIGIGTPRGLAGLCAALLALWALWRTAWTRATWTITSVANFAVGDADIREHLAVASCAA